MANVVVMYNTVTGFSRTFGEWIADGYDHSPREATAPLVAKAREILGEA